MVSWQKISLLAGVFLLLSSCTCGVPLKVTSIQRSDKKLACKDIILEINEAEHYREEATREKTIGVGEALMPVCWVSGYVDGTQAIQSANARIEYLGHIYDLLDCGGNQSQGPARQQPRQQLPPPPPIVVPANPIPQPPPRQEFIPPNPGQTLEYAPYNSLDHQIKEPHYRQKQELGNARLHEHRDGRGKLYVHSHIHNGPHRHLEDE